MSQASLLPHQVLSKSKARSTIPNSHPASMPLQTYPRSPLNSLIRAYPPTRRKPGHCHSDHTVTANNQSRRRNRAPRYLLAQVPNKSPPLPNPTKGRHTLPALQAAHTNTRTALQMRATHATKPLNRLPNVKAWAAATTPLRTLMRASTAATHHKGLQVPQIKAWPTVCKDWASTRGKSRKSTLRSLALQRCRSARYVAILRVMKRLSTITSRSTSREPAMSFLRCCGTGLFATKHTTCCQALKRKQSHDITITIYGWRYFLSFHEKFWSDTLIRAFLFRLIYHLNNLLFTQDSLTYLAISAS